MQARKQWNDKVQGKNCLLSEYSLYYTRENVIQNEGDIFKHKLREYFS